MKRSGSVQIIPDPDSGAQKLTDPTDPEHWVTTLLHEEQDVRAVAKP